MPYKVPVCCKKRGLSKKRNREEGHSGKRMLGGTVTVSSSLRSGKELDKEKWEESMTQWLGLAQRSQLCDLPVTSQINLASFFLFLPNKQLTTSIKVLLSLISPFQFFVFYFIFIVHLSLISVSLLFQQSHPPKVTTHTPFPHSCCSIRLTLAITRSYFFI